MRTREFESQGLHVEEAAELKAAIRTLAREPECRLCGGPADYVGVSIPDRVAGGVAFPFACCPDCRKVPGWVETLEGSFDDSEGVSLRRSAEALWAV